MGFLCLGHAYGKLILRLKIERLATRTELSTVFFVDDIGVTNPAPCDQTLAAHPGTARHDERG
jgi:hypothetical protein